jgi:hypothetical protein
LQGIDGWGDSHRDTNRQLTIYSNNWQHIFQNAGVFKWVAITKVTSWEPLIGSGSEASANMVIIHYQEHEDASLVSLNDLQILSIFFLGKGENWPIDNHISLKEALIRRGGKDNI